MKYVFTKENLMNLKGYLMKIQDKKFPLFKIIRIVALEELPDLLQVKIILEQDF